MKTNSDKWNDTCVNCINTIEKLLKKLFIKYTTWINIYFIQILYKIK